MTGAQIFPWSDPRPGRTRCATQQSAKYIVDSGGTSHTVLASSLTGGASLVVRAMTGALTAAANATTDTAANIIAAIPQPYVGQSYKLRIINKSTGAYAWTVVAGSGVTLTGTATIAQNTWREFIVTITSLTAVSLQECGTGTDS